LVRIKGVKVGWNWEVATMYPCWMEVAGYVSLAVVGIVIFLVSVLVKGPYLAIGEIVGWLLIELIRTWVGASRRT
jgi:hypothetical protein